MKIYGNATVRLTASEFKIGKSTVYKDMSERLQEMDMKLYEDVRRISDTNFKEKAIRGGLATQKKYMKKRKTYFKRYVFKLNLHKINLTY